MTSSSDLPCTVDLNGSNAMSQFANHLEELASRAEQLSKDLPTDDASVYYCDDTLESYKGVLEGITRRWTNFIENRGQDGDGQTLGKVLTNYLDKGGRLFPTLYASRMTLVLQHSFSKTPDETKKLREAVEKLDADQRQLSTDLFKQSLVSGQLPKDSEAWEKLHRAIQVECSETLEEVDVCLLQTQLMRGVANRKFPDQLEEAVDHVTEVRDTCDKFLAAVYKLTAFIDSASSEPGGRST